LSAFLEAWPSIKSEVAARALLVTGPLMDEETMRALEEGAARMAGVSLVRSSNNMLSLVGAADLVVSMGGYNSVVEAVTARKRLLISPRVWPRREQLLRAEAFARLGLARCLRVEDAGAEGLAQAVRETMARPVPPAKAWAKVDLGGGDRVADELVQVVAALKMAG
jgi:predicted glycosyltransferase